MVNRYSRHKAEMPLERYYVYTLSYPDGRIFYVGKGQGDRILAHEREAKSGEQSQKCQIIREIWSRGEEVVKTKLAFFDMEPDALRYESALISKLGGLSNIASGRKNIRELLISSGDRAYFGYSIRRFRDDGTEYYDAREVAGFFGYISWENFHKLLNRVKNQWMQMGRNVSLDFIPVQKKILIGKYSAKRSILNYELTRDAFLMITVNMGTSTPVACIGADYVARMLVKSHEQDRDKSYWLTQADLDALEEEISDWMDSEELGANIFRATQTDAAMRRDQIKGREQAYQTHFTIGRKVRDFIINELGGTPPELIPKPDKGIDQLKKEETHQLKQKQQPSLFDEE